MENQVTSQKNHTIVGRKYCATAFGNLIRIGHSDPTTMQSILDITSHKEEWLVRLSAGMPGGIGNTGHECGGVTSSLVLLGTQFGLPAGEGKLYQAVCPYVEKQFPLLQSSPAPSWL